MLRTVLITALAITLGGIASAAPGDLPPPIELASHGMIQCYSPDMAKKTCQSLAAYRAGQNGVIENVAEVLILASPAIVMTVKSDTTVRDGQVCGYVRGADLNGASFTLDGAGVNPEMTANFRGRVRALYGSTLEREICTAYVPDSDTLIARVTVDGALQSGEAMRVIWVSPSDGYRVGH